MRASTRLLGWMLTANAIGFAAVLLLGGGAAEGARRLLLWCGLG